MELNRIYNEDCLDGMKRIPDSSVDAIVTSPPYNLGGDFHTMSQGKRISYGGYSESYQDDMEEREYQEWQSEILKECHRVLKDDGVMFYNHKNRIVENSIISPIEWISKSDFNLMQMVVMNLRSTANVDKRRFFPVHEVIFILTKNKETKLNNHFNLTDVWDVSKVKRKVSGHPATFHVEVPKRCIYSSTGEGDIVLDPFMGSGTTAIACMNTERNFIGFEIDKTYYEKSLKRIKNHTTQTDIFDVLEGN